MWGRSLVVGCTAEETGIRTNIREGAARATWVSDGGWVGRTRTADDRPCARQRDCARRKEALPLREGRDAGAPAGQTAAIEAATSSSAPARPRFRAVAGIDRRQRERDFTQLTHDSKTPK